MDNAIQIKDNLISRIRSSNDLNFLKAIQTIFDSSEQELFKLTETQSKSIEMSRKQIENGKFVENKEVVAEIKGWLESQ